MAGQSGRGAILPSLLKICHQALIQRKETNGFFGYAPFLYPKSGV
jgi:hypothetical protein